MDEQRFSDRDLERNEDPEKVAGAVTGATAAGLGAGLGMAALGPVGAVIGALVGATGGWWAGKGMQGAIEEIDRTDSEFRRVHEHAGAEHSYDEVRHGYQLGWLAGRNPRYADDTFAAAEPELRAAWVKAHLEESDPVSWDAVRGSARAGFDLARTSG